MAIDNELDSPKPFNYPCELPTDEYKEYAYAKEAGVIYKWMTKLPNGVSKDTIVLARREFGIDSREVVLGALRDLIKQEMIEEFRPKPSSRVGRNVRHKSLRVKGNPMPDIEAREETDDEQS